MPELVQAAGHEDIELATFANDGAQHPFGHSGTTTTVNASRDASPSSSTRQLKATESELHAVGLPPVDKGRGAWLFVLNAFFLETFIWGYSFSYGSIQLYLSTHPPFEVSSLASIGAVGTIALAIQYTAPLGLMLVFKRYSEKAKAMLWVALIVNSGAMLISSWATKVWQLIILQGVLCGLSGAVLYVPVLVWLQEWFVEKRGIASGIIFAGTGMGGFAFPFLIETCLDKYGFPWACRIWAILTLAVFGFSVATLQPRLPTARVPNQKRGAYLPVDMSFVHHPVVIAMFFTTLFSSLSSFPVSLYLPIYVSSLSSSSLTATTVLAIFNAVSVIGQVGAGWLSDRFEVALIIAGLGIGSGVTALVAWGLADTLAKVFGFAILYGAFSGICSTWSTVAKDIAGYNPLSASMIFSIFAVARGIAAVIGPLIASALYDREAAGNSDATYGAFGFRNLQLFVGVMGLGSALGAFAVVGAKRLKRE